MQDINIGLIGAGYMGKAHTIAYKAVRSIFPTTLNPLCECICTSSAEGAARSAQELGWNRSTGDWRALVTDPAIDAIIVATPPATHKDIVLAALALGKPVFCEKPLGMTAAESLLLAELRHGDEFLDHWAGLPGLAVHDVSDEVHSGSPLDISRSYRRSRMGANSACGRRTERVSEPRSGSAWGWGPTRN